MVHNKLIEKISVPLSLRKRTTLAGSTYYDTVEIYENRVTAYDGERQMTWYYKDYNTVDIISANINSQFAQVVFLTGINSNNRFVGLDFGASQNRNAMRDSNRLIFCSGMFSWANANDFASSLGGKIRKAMDAYKNFAEEENSSSGAISAADELKKFKDLLDTGVISQEEFDAKKKQLLGL